MDKPTSAIFLPAAKFVIPDCTEPTDWRPIRFWKDWCRGVKAIVRERAKTPAQYYGPSIDTEPGGTLASQAWLGLGVSLYYRYSWVIVR